MPRNSQSALSKREAVRAALLEGSVRQAVVDRGYYAEVQRMCADYESSPGEIEFAKDVVREAHRRMSSSSFNVLREDDPTVTEPAL